MKNKITTSLILLLCCTLFVSGQIQYQTESFKVKINKNGELTHFIDVADNTNYAANESSFLIKAKIEGKIESPVDFRSKKGQLIYTFPKGVVLSVCVESKPTHLRFELCDIEKGDHVQAIVWGPFKTTISDVIGEFVGVVRSDQYAIGIQALNVKTTGGDLLNDEGTVYSRGSTAVPQEYGSSLQAFCINRTRPQEIEVWGGFKKTKVVANENFNPEGSAIALFGIEESKALENIGKIELEEGLPHIIIEGEWIKNSKKAGRPYIISGFGEADIDKMLDFTEEVGFYSLYQSHPFKDWGHFELLPSLFPRGRESVKYCVEQAKERNILLGVHTLTNFITTTDPYVSPVPHKGLVIFAETNIEKGLSKDDTEIIIASREGYDKKTTLQTVRIGDELIRFSSISEIEPYTLQDCKRGAFGTTATTHENGALIGRLLDHPYKTFYPDMNLQNEMIDNLVDFFNETGVSHLDFDGHEGTYATGYGDASKDYFALRFLEGVKHPVINGTSRSGHFYWHLNTYMNWGEPWYGGMRESQNKIRFNNQATLERNYQPNMLGWFWFHDRTTVEEMEWMLARAAGWNAGYALVVNPKDIDLNPYTDQVIKDIQTWEEAKNLQVFNEEQLDLLKSGENDFSLTKSEAGIFHLQYYKKEKFRHENIILQPGQPNYTEWNFSNDGPSQKLYFQIGAEGEEGSVEGIVLEIDNNHILELPLVLKAGHSFIYNGTNTLFVYDEKGRLRKKEKIYAESVALEKGEHMIRISCKFAGADIELKGVVRLKDKVDIIKL